MHREAKDAAASTEALKFFHWAYSKGGEMASGLDYVPLPDSVVKLAEQTWRTSIQANGKPLWK